MSTSRRNEYKSMYTDINVTAKCFEVLDRKTVGLSKSEIPISHCYQLTLDIVTETSDLFNLCQNKLIQATWFSPYMFFTIRTK
jgi:hypothetical protein